MEVQAERKERLKAALLAQLEGRMQVEDQELRERIDRAVLEEGGQCYLPLTQRLKLGKELFDSFRRLDILQELVDDPDITEIMVNGSKHIFVERRGAITQWDKEFESTEQLEDLIQQIVSRVNRTVNLSSPIADARLEDGSRVHVVLKPVAVDGPVLTIRKFPEPITMQKLISYGSITTEAASFLNQAVRAGYNIFISGGTGSGKTTFLNALSGFIPKEERIITIEDSAELQIRHIPNLVRLETRAESRDGAKEISMRDLIRASLRMRPDRIIVGEVRGAEAAGHEYRPRRLYIHRAWKQPGRYADQIGNHGFDGGGSSAGSGKASDSLSAGSADPCEPDAGQEPEGRGDFGGDRV